MKGHTTDHVGEIRRATITGIFAIATLFAVPAQANEITIKGATAHMHDDAVNGRRIEVYMDIANGGGPDRLFAVRSRLSRQTMLSVPGHEDQSGHGDGHDTMAGMSHHLRTSVLEIPARSVARLEMGGAHIMLMEPSPVPRPGETFPVTLFFERAGRMNVDIVLASEGTMQGMDAQHAGH